MSNSRFSQATQREHRGTQSSSSSGRHKPSRCGSAKKGYKNKKQKAAEVAAAAFQDSMFFIGSGV